MSRVFLNLYEFVVFGRNSKLNKNVGFEVLTSVIMMQRLVVR
jgi:hypothetical protein